MGITELAGEGDYLDDERPLAFIHARDETSFARAASVLTRAYRIGGEPELHPPVHDYIRARRQMSRAILVILDSVGIGGAPDAARFGDEGANTHRPYCREGRAETSQSCGARPRRSGGNRRAERGRAALRKLPIRGQWGYAVERSNGKDTPSGHWEIAGAPVTFDWGYFPRTIPASRRK